MPVLLEVLPLDIGSSSLFDIRNHPSAANTFRSESSGFHGHFFLGEVAYRRVNFVEPALGFFNVPFCFFVPVLRNGSIGFWSRPRVFFPRVVRRFLLLLVIVFILLRWIAFSNWLLRCLSVVFLLKPKSRVEIVFQLFLQCLKWFSVDDNLIFLA